MDLMWSLNKNCLFFWGLTLKTVSIRHTQEVLFELLIIMEVLGTTHYVRTDVKFELTDFGFSSRNPNCAAHSTVVHNGRNFQISSKNYDTFFAFKVVKNHIQMIISLLKLLKSYSFNKRPIFLFVNLSSTSWGYDSWVGFIFFFHRLNNRCLTFCNVQ